ncbi:hypothetical protein BLA18112_01613 [Burkholderia lata]|uniref:Lipoprotein n=1 Tax=Burkholderia lata (strain ATCC 17760 / DSM 23089 / LMG 22485 / NCIMB 9086 / R18194 / 383) TaxID=482957 RepID=A0A6P2TS26_BURL3|nr:hypothetical protein [Burkholderia lata]VWC66832.1 hypothetical protein BLA18112_01613 [Burkholderia lata]
MSKSMTIIRRLACLTSVLALGACSSDCSNLLSGSHSTACNLAWGAAIVAVAPVALVSSAIDDHRQNEREEETWKRWKAGDPPVVARCVVNCQLPLRVTQSDSGEYKQLFARSLDQIIAWWGEHPTPGQLPVVAVAYQYKGQRLMESDPAAAEAYLRKAAVMVAEPEMAEGLESDYFPVGVVSNNKGYYEKAAQEIQESLMILRFRKNGASADDFRCQPIAAWPPSYPVKLDDACRHAYQGLYDPEYKKISYTYQRIDSVYEPVRPK